MSDPFEFSLCTFDAQRFCWGETVKLAVLKTLSIAILETLFDTQRSLFNLCSEFLFLLKRTALEPEIVCSMIALCISAGNCSKRTITAGFLMRKNLSCIALLVSFSLGTAELTLFDLIHRSTAPLSKAGIF